MSPGLQPRYSGPSDRFCAAPWPSAFRTLLQCGVFATNVKPKPVMLLDRGFGGSRNGFTGLKARALTSGEA